MKEILTFNSVNAYYGSAQILRDVSFSIGEGEAVALLGRNGAGKTTAALSIYGVPRVSGEILVEGIPLNVRHHYSAANQGVALCLQGRHILPNLTVEENLLLGTAPGRKGQWDLPSVYALFPILKDRSTAKGDRMSGGQQQMLTIARALMSNPRVLVLDEPTEGLAPVAIDELSDALLTIRDRGTAMLLIEQNVGLVLAVTQRFMVLVKGEIALRGKTDEVVMSELQRLIAV